MVLLAIFELPRIPLNCACHVCLLTMVGAVWKTVAACLPWPYCLKPRASKTENMSCLWLVTVPLASGQ